MRRRLFEGPDQGLGEELHLIEDLSAPGHDGGACSLAVCLQIALQAAGQPTTYARLMGQSGAAFMLRVGDSFLAELPVEGRDAHVVQAFTELGQQVRLTPAPDPQAAFELCRGEVMAGRPVLARGWGSNPGEWALIAGVQGSGLLGLCFGGGGRRERHAAVVASLLTLRQAAAPVSVPDALRPAVALLAANGAQYKAWLALLDGAEPYGPPLLRVQGFLSEQWLSAYLADARDAAARYLTSLAEVASEDLAEALEPAADCAGRLAEQAERLLVPPDAIHRAHLPEDLDWRQRRRESLLAMRTLEDQLQDHLRRALRDAGNLLDADE